MTSDWQNAKDRLLAGDVTCVLARGDDLQTSALRGVRPLLTWLESGSDFRGYTAADKVVGKATAFLYVLLGVTAVYAHVISAPALDVLKRHGIAVDYGSVTDNIINRKGDGICPFEAAVLSVNDPDRAYAAIKKRLQELSTI